MKKNALIAAIFAACLTMSFTISKIEIGKTFLGKESFKIAKLLGNDPN